METLMVDRVHSSLRSFMNKNAIFLCERLCAEFPSELNLQLLATCYLRNNQAYCAYHILKGTRMPQSRYLFAISCFQMNLFREAEAALSPVNEPNPEVPSGAAGHYLLGLIYRYTGRRSSAIHHFMQALAIDPLLWTAYEELCVLGAAEEANECFSDSAVAHIQQQQLSESCSENWNVGNDDRSAPCNRFLASGDFSPRKSKQPHVTSIRDPRGTTGSCQYSNNIHNLSQYNTPSPTVAQLSGVAPPPLCRNPQQYLNMNAAGGDGFSRLNANAVGQARRKVLDDGKIRKVSGRLFSGSDSGVRRSTRLSGEAMANANSNVSQVGGNGTNNSSKSLGGILSSSRMNSRSVTHRKGQQWASENFDEGRRAEIFDDMRMDNSAATSSSTSSFVPTIPDGRCTDQDRVNFQIGGTFHESRTTNGIVELLGLFFY